MEYPTVVNLAPKMTTSSSNSWPFGLTLRGGGGGKGHRIRSSRVPQSQLVVSRGMLVNVKRVAKRRASFVRQHIEELCLVFRMLKFEAEVRRKE